MTNHRTTILGILAIVGALVKAGSDALSNQPLDLPTLLSAIVSGIGLIAAKDAANKEVK